ncbi:hypothetical protein GOB91_09530 [Sinorhizobium meliloti]|uniref:hypothetical protein n=1 Tax=Rhizobium meliloti TaxID=382 RepID=UPI000FDC151C|nr:hypothetical protein [Sinorhizobium meliloti]MDW9722559.1 hypothetical protein [Sinorhizobium meliloti]MDW9730775.1 hypothetical protein [Sinorhizobium meliloti]MDW9784899.1 hypothetical protein [Sinorhizobium meliloti]RVG29950.1 hypothetical protein CN225_23825 [Sinorhizobium meliloti]
MRIASAIAIAALSTTPLAAFAQECQERVKASSIAALDGYARKYGLVVAASQMASSIEEIATTLCSRPDASVIALAEERIGRVVEKYVSDAAEYGHASRIGAIVGEIFDGQNAIARPDRRRYAVLAVMCSVPITDSRVDIADEEKGSCGDRFMVDVGTIAVRVRSDKTALCLSDVKVQERQRLSCNCTVNSTSSISSVPLECQ